MGRSANSGALSESIYYILLRLHRPAHGYALMKDILDMTNQRVNLGAGTLYGALDTLEKKGWIRSLDSQPQDRKIEYVKQYKINKGTYGVYDKAAYIKYRDSGKKRIVDLQRRVRKAAADLDYKITPNRIDKMLKEQNFTCKYCENP